MQINLPKSKKARYASIVLLCVALQLTWRDAADKSLDTSRELMDASDANLRSTVNANRFLTEDEFEHEMGMSYFSPNNPERVEKKSVWNFLSRKRSTRSLASEIDVGKCKWTTIDPVNWAEVTNGVEGTFLVGFPGVGKRFGYKLLELLTGQRSGDDWDHSGRGFDRRVGIMKGSYPHHESQPWWFYQYMSQVILQVRNPRWMMPSFRNMKDELIMSRFWETSHERMPYVYTNRINVGQFEEFRDSYQLEFEIHQWSWQIDFWMEGGLRRRFGDHSLWEGMEPYNWRCKTDEHPERFLECKPVLVVSYDNLIDPYHGPEEFARMARAMRGQAGYNVREDPTHEISHRNHTYDCLWNLLISPPEKGGPKTPNDRRAGPQREQYTFNSTQIHLLNGEIERVRAKYSSGEWAAQETAQQLVSHTKRYLGENNAEIVQVMTQEQNCAQTAACTDTIPCDGEPCQNGGTCPGIFPNADNTAYVYQCVGCEPGWTGHSCHIDIDECAPEQCLNGATCVDHVNAYTCVCAPGFEGVHCEINIDECLSNPCLNGATCIDGIAEYTCDCAAGFQGFHCQTNIDECASSPCQNGAPCIDGIADYTCTCPAGYTGKDCEINIDECASDPCQNGGECTDGIAEYLCTCLPGYGGANCEINIDECESSPCLNGAICTDLINDYACTCADGFKGRRCGQNIDECASGPCQNGGVCADGINGYTCTCPLGFEGSDCEVDVNECASAPCQNGATCIDGPNSYTCACVLGFSGTDCEINIDECADGPCQNGAACTDGINEYTCSCLEGFEGVNCEVDINDCAGDPCQNGGFCTDYVNSYLCTCAPGYEGANCEINTNECGSLPCQNGGVCTDEVNGYTCTCAAGYEGDNCETNIDECANVLCQNGGTCIDAVDGFSCACVAGYEGVLCEINTNECALEPCQNGGTCVDQVNGHTCTCPAGYEGPNCEINTNECAVEPCQNGGTCTDGINGYTCACPAGFTGLDCETACPAGFTGVECEINIDDCAAEPCVNGGTCYDGDNGYTCVCPSGLAGINCEINDECAQTAPCLNGGTCIDNNPGVGYTCSCPAGYGGLNCETDIDDCAGDPCLNGGTCADLFNGYTCTCPEGFSGSNCEIDHNECETAPCLNGGTCTDGANGYTCSCLSGFAGLNCEVTLSTNAWVDMHNQRRAYYHGLYDVSYVPVQWYGGLADDAQAYANYLVGLEGCQLIHDPNRVGGENLAASSYEPTEDDVLHRWVENEDETTGTPWPDNGRFTQVVWRATQYIGCGQAWKDSCYIQVCRYVTPGNCNANADNFVTQMLSDHSPCLPQLPWE